MNYTFTASDSVFPYEIQALHSNYTLNYYTPSDYLACKYTEDYIPPSNVQSNFTAQCPMEPGPYLYNVTCIGVGVSDAGWCGWNEIGEPIKGCTVNCTPAPMDLTLIYNVTYSNVNIPIHCNPQLWWKNDYGTWIEVIDKETGVITPQGSVYLGSWQPYPAPIEVSDVYNNITLIDLKVPGDFKWNMKCNSTAISSGNPVVWAIGHHNWTFTILPSNP